MTGFDLAEKIEELRGAEFPFFMMSTEDDVGNVRAAERIDAMAFVRKDYESLKYSMKLLQSRQFG